jgi:hypothetical protein
MPFKNPHPLYKVWMDMRVRCRNPKNKAWVRYGGRGIHVCPEWDKSFAQFVADMGPRPDGFDLDRINHDGNYEPSNCRWIDHKTNCRNQRRQSFVTIGGEQYRTIELADKAGLKADTILERAKSGLSLEQVTSPERRRSLAGLALGGEASGAKKRALTHCKNGHPFTEENILRTPEGWRACRRCHADRQIRRYHRLRGQHA